jgi:hypothetical protein
MVMADGLIGIFLTNLHLSTSRDQPTPFSLLVKQDNFMDGRWHLPPSPAGGSSPGGPSLLLPLVEVHS